MVEYLSDIIRFNNIHKRKTSEPLEKIDQIYDILEITKDDKDLEMFLKYEGEYSDTIIDKNKNTLMTPHHNMISDNDSFLEELSDYFVLYIDKEYPKYLYQLIAPTARNLIPSIITLRRKHRRYFKMKLFNASWSSETYLINYIFISVDQNNFYDDRIILERLDGVSHILE